jgi:hypothetical protein
VTIEDLLIKALYPNSKRASSIYQFLAEIETILIENGLI